MRRRVGRGLAVLVASAVAACAQDRVRLAPPRLTLALGPGPVCFGCEVLGQVTAVDGDGVTYIAVEARSATDTVTRRTWNLIPRDSITINFALRTALNAPANSMIVVTATAIDEQLFTTTRVDTAFVQSP